MIYFFLNVIHNYWAQQIVSFRTNRFKHANQKLESQFNVISEEKKYLIY